MPSRPRKRVVSIRGVRYYKRIVVQLYVDVLHNISNGAIQSSKLVVVYVGENGNVEIVVLTCPLRIGRKQIDLNPIVKLL